MLAYSGTLHFYADKTFFTIDYPEDGGFQGDPSITIQLETCMQQENLAELRQAFLGNASPPPWKKLFHNGKLIPAEAAKILKAQTETDKVKQSE